MSGLQLPYGLPSAAGWQIVDWLTVQGTSPAAAGGLATLELQQLEPDTMWLVDHMVVQCTSSTATTLRLYDSSVAPGSMLDGTSAGNLNVSDWPAGLVIRSTRYLVAQWTNAADGAVGSLTLQARLMRRS